MTPEEYILEQCSLFEQDLKTAGVDQLITYKGDSVSNLDDLRQLAYPEGTENLENAVAIRWGAAFTRMIAETYVSRWQVDPETKLPVVVLKCGDGRGMQIKAIVYAAKAFKTGESFLSVWNDLVKTLTEAGAERKL